MTARAWIAEGQAKHSSRLSSVLRTNHPLYTTHASWSPLMYEYLDLAS
eukprot:COSAG01_NODE_975_length_12366_cov_20.561833_12_plen_48_part_00